VPVSQITNDGLSLSTERSLMSVLRSTNSPKFLLIARGADKLPSAAGQMSSSCSHGDGQICAILTLYEHLISKRSCHRLGRHFRTKRRG
jgi:hypothetical protein